ncbi:MAG: ubiquitin carboxyl-terminal hydrolase [Chlamydiales bacterium]|nr:ubiquitin carboxyl-terminal hydrolase [Chlamydiales bacterium]
MGLRNLSNDCWANASFQLMMNSARLKALMPDNPHIKELMEAYEYTQRQEQRFVRTPSSDDPGKSNQVIGGECIRRAIIDLRASEGGDIAERDRNPATRYISSSSRHSEDAVCFFESLLGDSIQFSHQIGDRKSDMAYPDWAIHLSPGSGAVDDFEGLLVQELEEEIEDLETAAMQIKSTQFVDSPEGFLLHIKRFFQVWSPETGRMLNYANHEKVQVPFSFTLPSKYRRDGQEEIFNCRGFILHTSAAKTTLGGGHYVAYVKDGRGRWWLCNDRSVRQQVQEAEVLARMPFGYIYDFARSE